MSKKADKTEPRSLRLNAGHREDILTAVMKQWDKTNPAPAGSRFEDFIEAVLTRLMKPKRNDPAEMRALTHLVKRTQAMVELRDTIPAEYQNLVSIKKEEDFRLTMRLDSGENGAEYVFRLPKAMADKLGIPYISTGTRSRSSDTNDFPSYCVENAEYSSGKCLEIAILANQNSYNSLVIDRSFPAYRAYREGEKALRQWETDRQKIREEISDYLNQFNTTGQIRDQWPEMEQYLPAHLADPEKVIKLPALTRSRLKERLGL